MRLTACLAATAALACLVQAQLQPQNRYMIWPDKLEFTSRGVVPGSSDGEALQMFGPSFIRGLGDAGAAAIAAQIAGHYIIWQDQDRSTQEAIYSICRKATKAGRPDPANGAWYWKVPIKHPGGPKGIAAFASTIAFGRPPILPFQGTYFPGLGFPKNTVWTRDGISVHTAGFSFGTLGDDPRGWGTSKNPAKAPNPAWNIDLTKNSVAQPSGRVWRQGLDVDTPVLESGGITGSSRAASPNYGWGGLYLDTGMRSDGQAFRIRDAKNAGGIGFVVAGPPLPAWRLPLPFVVGSLYMLGTPLVVASKAGLSKVQVLTPAFFGQGKISRSVSGAIAYQAVTVGPAGIRISQRIDVSYD